MTTDDDRPIAIYALGRQPTIEDRPITVAKGYRDAIVRTQHLLDAGVARVTWSLAGAPTIPIDQWSSTVAEEIGEAERARRGYLLALHHWHECSADEHCPGCEEDLLEYSRESARCTDLRRADAGHECEVCEDPYAAARAAWSER